MRRFAFSSTGDPIRAPGAKVVAKENPLVSWVNSAAESLFATLFPANCRLCDAPLVKISRLPVCETCLSDIHPIAEGTCVICGERLFLPYTVSGDPNEPRCPLCRRIEPPFARATAYGSYESGLRELLHLLKYDQVRPAAAVLGRMLAEAIANLEPFFADQTVVVVPVPLHPQKLRQRSFNQAEMIAHAALKFRPAVGRMSLQDGVLLRRRPTQSQIGLSSHQRRENLRGAFTVAKPEAIAGREVLLVDDVFTTGTTVSECARILRRAGASKVWVATVARTLREEAERAEVGTRIEVRVAAAAHG
jgi:ComF family protein